MTDIDVDAVVVGAGPNGLAAALVLAAAGLRVEVHEAADTAGGGVRTQELILPGHHHDVCSAVHPMGVASPFFRAFDLASQGVRMATPEASYAHPLDGGRAAVAWRDIDRTIAGLGPDGSAWSRLLRPLAERAGPLVDAVMSDLRRVPPHLPDVARLGLRILEQASPGWNARFRGDLAPALITGVACHAIRPPRALAPAGVGLLLAALGHAVGWPLPIGGSQVITDAMVTQLRARGGRVITGHRVRSLDELPPARAVLLDVAPRTLVEIAGDRLPLRYRRQLRGFRHGAGVCKVDFVLSGPVPWAAPECAAAGTLHLVGSRAEAVRAESDVAAGRHAERPFVLAVQPGVVDPGRAPAGRQTFWTYVHVPHRSTRDVGEQVKQQVERFAPGFRDLIVAERVVTAAEQELHNPNYVGGDISGGATNAWQLVMRPAPRWDSYRTPVPGVYICSASTPPGQAVHGMCGVHAARRALRDRFGVHTDPLKLVADAYRGRQPAQPC
jgi:phytoene dehydrogenase-like protein